jgi:hypothetical protein
MATTHIPLNSLQTAVYTALSNDATLQSLSVTVADWVPETHDWPLVAIGAYDVERDTTKALPIIAATFEIECWSNGQGYKELNQIMDAVCQALTADTALSLSGNYEVTDGNLSHAEAFPDVTPQGEVVRHGIVNVLWHVAYVG